MASLNDFWLRVLHPDNGREFKNRLLKEMKELRPVLAITQELINTAPYRTVVGMDQKRG